MTIEKTVIAKFNGADGVTREFELRPNGEVIVRDYCDGSCRVIDGFTLEQLAQAFALFQKESL
jgi:hypothetical protein